VEKGVGEERTGKLDKVFGGDFGKGKCDSFFGVGRRSAP
jgi:hypothetical protein